MQNETVENEITELWTEQKKNRSLPEMSARENPYKVCFFRWFAKPQTYADWRGSRILGGPEG